MTDPELVRLRILAESMDRGWRNCMGTVERLEAERDGLRAALQELVVLKALKNDLLRTGGSITEYRQRKDAAWTAARAALRGDTDAE